MWRVRDGQEWCCSGDLEIVSGLGNQCRGIPYAVRGLALQIFAGVFERQGLSRTLNHRHALSGAAACSYMSQGRPELRQRCGPHRTQSRSGRPVRRVSRPRLSGRRTPRARLPFIDAVFASAASASGAARASRAHARLRWSEMLVSPVISGNASQTHPKRAVSLGLTAEKSAARRSAQQCDDRSAQALELPWIADISFRHSPA